MAATAIITTVNSIFVALTPVERWQAARGSSNNFMAERWFIVAAAVILGILTVLLVWVSYHQLVVKRKAGEQTFSANVEKRGLSRREHSVLIEVLKRSGLNQRDAIFTTPEAFDQGTVRLMQEFSARRSPEENRRLRHELSILRRKLGFERPSNGVMTAKAKKATSRQIPVDKTLYITRRTTHASDNIEATVIENNEVELTIKLARPVKVTFGEIWRVSYYFGASVWEFDTSVISYDGDVLVLNHSEDVRFVNRRRFARVPVKNLAFISSFPFARTLATTSGTKKKGAKGKSNLKEPSWKDWKPLEFVPAVVTELAGPGLRVEASLKVEVGERVLVIFKLDEQANRPGEEEQASARIVEDIGEVRRCEASENGFSIAIELIGLRDSDVSELVRAANSVHLKTGEDGEPNEDSGGDEAVNENEKAAQPAGVEGA